MEALERYEIEQRRPLMDCVTYSDKSWTTVELQDCHSGAWQWGEGEYYNWCDANCTDKYNIVKYKHQTIVGRFKSAADATAFVLRWS
jgi:hypothetical protein